MRENGSGTERTRSFATSATSINPPANGSKTFKKVRSSPVQARGLKPPARRPGRAAVRPAKALIPAMRCALARIAARS